MRLLQIAVLVVIGTGMGTDALAGPRGSGGGGAGGDGGGGRLGKVSSGMASATSANTSRDGGGSPTSDRRDWMDACPTDQYRRRIYDGLCERRCPEGEEFRPNTGRCVRRPVEVAVLFAGDAASDADARIDGGTATTGPQGVARVSGFVVAQKVMESDGAVALQLAVSDRWLRVAGTLTRFYEQQQRGAPLTLTMPSLALGVRIDDRETTRVYLEAGVVGAWTKNDPMMDSSITGGLGGVHVEHAMSKHTTLMGAARLMLFEDDVRAASLRAGVRYRNVQASFSILDFNVGPALYGPELGVGF
jgi:hypothetical protein